MTKVGIRTPDTLLDVVQSLKELVRTSPTVDELRHKAQEADLEIDSEFLEELHRRLKKQARDSAQVVARQAVEDEIVDTFWEMVVRSGAANGKGQAGRSAVLAAARRYFMESGVAPFKAAAEVAEIALETGMGYSPNLDTLSHEFSVWRAEVN